MEWAFDALEVGGSGTIRSRHMKSKDVLESGIYLQVSYVQIGVEAMLDVFELVDAVKVEGDGLL